jgi:hypothetical protein
MDVVGPVPGLGLVGADGVVVGPVALGVLDQVQDVVDLSRNSHSSSATRTRVRGSCSVTRVPQFVGRCHARSRGLTWENRRDTGELGRLHAITLTGPVGTVVQTTEPTAQTGILRACQLALPPRITTLDPA